MAVELASLAAMGLMGHYLLSDPAQKAARGVQLTCQEQYCSPTYLIHVDKPMNTLMRDDRAMATHPPPFQRNQKHDFDWGAASVSGKADAAWRLEDGAWTLSGPKLSLDEELKAAYHFSKDTYYTEAHQHPGVQLVAETVS